MISPPESLSTRAVRSLETLLLFPLLGPIQIQVAPELWEKLGGEGFVAMGQFPEPSDDVDSIDQRSLQREDYLKGVIDDINNTVPIIIYDAPEEAPDDIIGEEHSSFEIEQDNISIFLLPIFGIMLFSSIMLIIIIRKKMKKQ